eukprot:9395588-Heterocapsa_arctica.AAC.1
MGRTCVPPVAVVPHKAKGANPLAALGRALAANPMAAYLAAPKADPTPPGWVTGLAKAKRVQQESGRARSAPAPKHHAAPAKASPPTVGRPPIAKATPLMAQPRDASHESAGQSSGSQWPIPKPQ